MRTGLIALFVALGFAAGCQEAPLSDLRGRAQERSWTMRGTGSRQSASCSGGLPAAREAG